MYSFQFRRAFSALTGRISNRKRFRYFVSIPRTYILSVYVIFLPFFPSKTFVFVSSTASHNYDRDFILSLPTTTQMLFVSTLRFLKYLPCALTHEQVYDRLMPSILVKACVTVNNAELSTVFIIAVTCTGSEFILFFFKN